MSVTHNLAYDLAAAAVAWAVDGGGPIGDTLSGRNRFTRTDLPVGCHPISKQDQNFLIEAVVSAAPPGLDGEAGARLWVHPHTAYLDATYGPNHFHVIQVRLVEETSPPAYRVGLYNQNDDLVQSLLLDWTTTGVAPYRIRLMRQGGSIVLAAEPSTGWDGAATQSVSVTLDETNFPATNIGGKNVVGFGNWGDLSQDSTWGSVHVTCCSDDTTALPYWPPAPVAPTLTVSGSSPGPYTVKAELDTSAGYVATDRDRVRAVLVTALDGTKTGALQDTGGSATTFTFPGLHDSQHVECTVTAVEAAGRSTDGAVATFDVPDRTNPVAPTIDTPAAAWLPWRTRFATPTITGTAEAGTTVRLYRSPTGGAPWTLVGFDTATHGVGGNAWSVTPTLALVEGLHYLEAEAEDGVGNVGPRCATVEMTVDLTPPMGGFVYTLDVAAAFAAQTWSDLPAGHVFKDPVQIGIKVDVTTFDDLDFDETANTRPRPRPSELTVTPTGAPALPLAMTSGDFACHPWPPAPAATTHHVFVLQSGGTPRTFTAHGPVALAGTLADLAGNTLALSSSFALDTDKPEGLVFAGPTATGPLAPLQASYPAGVDLYLALAVLKTTTDLDETNSTLLVRLASAGGAATSIAGLAKVSQSYGGNDYWCYVWPTPVNAAGSYVADFLVKDTPAGNQNSGTATTTLGQPSFWLEDNDILVSHTDANGGSLDPSGQLWNGAYDNFVGVRIHNSGTTAGDCKYRVFVIPRSLLPTAFTDTTLWKLVNNETGAPAVTGVPASGDKVSNGNHDYREGDANWPTGLFSSTDPLGTEVHSCMAAILHSEADKLELKDAAGHPVPITTLQFDDPAQFAAAVMAALPSYDGAGYWAAVGSNRKIANRNFSFVKKA